jgi:hypothetical protein
VQKIKFLIICTGISVLGLFFVNCASKSTSSTSPTSTLGCLEQLGSNTEWSNETPIEIQGYVGNAMEPKVSEDQITLFFNNKTGDDTQMDIHYALKTDPTNFPNRYVYKGTLTGTVQAGALDGVPAIDRFANFYFVSLRDYGTNYQTLYSGTTAVVAGPALEIQNVAQADSAVTRAQLYMVDMDVDVSWDGTLLVVSRADFTSGQGYPDSSYLALFDVPFVSGTSTRTAALKANSSTLLANVNLSECRVYAATLSDDLLELYYTVFPRTTNFTANEFKLVVAKRNNTSEAFGAGQIITAVTGELVEGPVITRNDGGKTLFYHRKDTVSGDFKIYKVTRP